MRPNGKVYLTGAGPGAVDLITVRAAEVLSNADVVVYDHLVNEELLNLVPENAELIYAGKQGSGERALDQSAINRLMIENARAGHRVVRLKGGDPFIFGRGGEEAAALAGAGIDFEVVPGITSAIAVPAFAGIPLTHRDHGSFVAFVTGHEDEARNAGAVPWDDLARAARERGTLVLLMATAHLRDITARLIAAGMAPQTPAAAIEHGTGASQRTVSATVGAIAEEVAQAQLGPPAIIVIGPAAALRENLAWLERRPLFGRRIIITRARAAAAPFAHALRELGAEAIELPTIETAAPDDYTALDRAIGQIASYGWIIFTAATGVDALLTRIKDTGHDVREMAGANLAAIGPATANRLRHYGLRAAIVPDEYRAEAIAGAIGPQRIRGARFLIPRAQVAREALIDLLKNAGAATVDVAASYKTVRPRSPVLDPVKRMLARGEIDLAAFTSPSTVNNFCAMVGNEAARGLAAAVIGPITGEAARARAMEVVVEPASYTVDALCTAIRDYFVAKAAAPSK
ncbi:MAG TPA: uroporphyrinogen-III C-methyltransferase [Candidatus Binataceae bacterium]|nr:uroporphyrinogen-III C-methyltransferase [Candidatus Binataceae bacterium]